MDFSIHKVLAFWSGKITMCGIELISQHESAVEFSIMIRFAWECYQQKINHYIKQINYDSINCIINCYFHTHIKEHDPIGVIFRKTAKECFGSIHFHDFKKDHVRISYVFEDDENDDIKAPITTDSLTKYQKTQIQAHECAVHLFREFDDISAHIYPQVVAIIHDDLMNMSNDE